MFTVSDIAEIIKRPQEEPRDAITRIRNWTKEGLLTPEGELNPGTGRARLYSAASVENAVLLQFLTDAAGMKAVAVAPQLEDARKELEAARKHLKKLGAEPFFLIMTRSLGDREWQMVSSPRSKIPLMLEQRSADAYSMIDLGRLIDRINAKRGR
ncbi:MerR family transcriptional regulator [Bradyrhizobium sp. PMVTL-01]|uniref:MerR family transcriptional regulator n=1 Tax=Bradyrhizobium sp. PMVTL-01 TaxID=3434999 RepID=UPI003F72B083